MQRKFTVVYELTIDPLEGMDPEMSESDAAEAFAAEVADEINQFHLKADEGETMELKSVKLVD